MAKNKSFQVISLHAVKCQVAGSNQPLQSRGVSTCYVLKSRFQEYAQKVGFPTPVYEIIKDGPSHKPTFRSTVIVNNVRYDSLPGFLNRKTAEQSAAEVALKQLVDSGAMGLCLSQPAHESGLCKHMLQDYAQKMNFAIPQYEMQWHERKGKITCSFSCTVEIGGIRYIGGAAMTKKEAEIKAARAALLAIQSSGLWPDDKPNEYSAYTVIPPMKKATDFGISNQESAAALKPKKGCFKRNKRRNASKQVCTKTTGDLEVQMVNQAEPELHENAAVSTQGTEFGPAPIGGDTTERSAVTGVGQLTSEVDSSASCLEQQTTCASDADQGRSTNREAEIS